MPCCRDPLVKNKLGNVFETPLKEIWNSEKALNFRREIVRISQMLIFVSYVQGMACQSYSMKHPWDLKSNALVWMKESWIFQRDIWTKISILSKCK